MNNYRKYCFLFAISAIILLYATCIACAVDNTAGTDELKNMHSIEKEYENDISDFKLDAYVEDDKVVSYDNDKEDRNQKSQSQYPIIYVSSNASEDNIGNTMDKPATITNAINYLEDGGSIYLITNSASDSYTLNSSLDYSYKSSFNIIGESGKNITIKSSSTELLHIYHTSINITNINFMDTHSTSSALYLSYSNVKINNCTFINNYRNNYSSCIYASSSNVTITNTNFINSRGVYGNIYTTSNSNVSITNCLFENNTAKLGGVIYSKNSYYNIKKSRFRYNNASYAGCIYLYNTKLESTNNIYETNMADYYGGAIVSLDNETLIIKTSNFTNNNASTAGAIYSMYTPLNITDSIFESNNAYQASAVFSYNNTLNIQKSALVTNSSNTSIVSTLAPKSCNLDNNWWGANDPNFNLITQGRIPNTWIVMGLYDDSDNAVKVTLNELSDGSAINTSIKRLVRFKLRQTNATISTFNIINNATKNYTCDKSELLVVIDNEVMDLYSKISPAISSSDITSKRNSTITIKINANKDISGNITLYVNNKKITTIKAQQVMSYSYQLPSTLKEGIYDIGIVYGGNSKYNQSNTTYKLTIQSSTYDNSNNITPTRKYSNKNVTIPSYYNLVDLNQTTPVKVQGSSGSCITFASMAALESSIKKVTGIGYDLSENNLKNIFKRFSVIGYPNLLPNDGGYDLEPVGYFASGLGPVLESEDNYDTESLLSPIYSSDIQVQNIYFIPHRQNYTDNNLIKEAIMKYGGVFTSIKSSSSLNIYSQSTTADHVVCIVGWNDTYSKENFNNNPPGDGAFIIKNSWGTSVGDHGYQYVSYYDHVIGDLLYTDSHNDINFAVDYNNVYNYSKIYQYDSVVYVYRIRDNSGSYSIKNIYTVNDSQCLSAVGTYFVNTSNYTIKVYINNNLVNTKTGSVDYPGYRTIYLDNFHRVNAFDEVVVTIDIQQNMDDNYIFVPLQDSDYPVYSTFNRSFISYDNGAVWEDLYTNANDYYTAPIKVYMMDIPKINSKVKYADNMLNISTEVLDLNGSTKLYYNINGDYIYTSNNKPLYTSVNAAGNVSIANSTQGLSNGNYTLETIMVYDGINITQLNYFTINDKNITLKVNDITAIINETKTVTIQVISNNTQAKINEGIITARYSNDTLIDSANVSNGQAKINVTNAKSGNYTITITYHNSTNYDDTYKKIRLTVNRIPTKLTVSTNNTYVLNTSIITGKLVDKYDNPLANAKVTIRINNNTYTVKTNATGDYKYNYKNTVVAKNNITVTYNASAIYNQSTKTTSYNTWKLSTTLTASTANTYVYNASTINGTLKDIYNRTLSNANITITINNNTYNTKTNSQGFYSFKYNNTIVAKNNVTVRYDATANYNACTKSIRYTTSILPTTISVSKISGTIGEKITLKASVKDKFGNPVKAGYVIFKINSVTVKDNGQINGSNNALKVYVENGVASTDIIAYLNVRYGQNLTAVYSGTSNYESARSNTAKMDISLRTAQIVVKCNVTKAKQDTYIKFTATIYDVTSGKRSSVIHNLSEQYVYFKVNGITMKNSDGTVYQAKIVNGVATYNYRIPIGFMGITDAVSFNVKNHSVTAGLYNKNYNPDVVNYTYFQVERSTVNITVTNCVINNRTHKMSLNATMKDYKNNYLVGPSKIIIKVNGVTLTDAKGNAIYFMIDNGRIQLKDINVPVSSKYTSLTIVTQDRLGYKSARATSTKITVKN
ncbi:MAG: C1 family peptidase [Methanosphaera sp.]|nr:C1 family peptidase [Methanosphaera sp.]